LFYLVYEDGSLIATNDKLNTHYAIHIFGWVIHL
jgi:hypothetical protein